jgi:hypothetical protein
MILSVLMVVTSAGSVREHNADAAIYLSVT